MSAMPSVADRPGMTVACTNPARPGAAGWVGLANYRYMLGDDPQIWPAVANTLWTDASVEIRDTFAAELARWASGSVRQAPMRTAPPAPLWAHNGHAGGRGSIRCRA